MVAAPMTVFQAIVLGLVQGLTEFLPVSSSGHLIIVPRLLGWETQPLSFDVMLHVSTMLAVLLYFRRDLWTLATAALGDALRHRLALGQWSSTGRLALLILLGCLPAVVVGGLFNTAIEERTRAVGLVAALLAMVGLVMLAAERWARTTLTMEELGPGRALLIGAAQALALLPGVSRSGATITAGMFAGLSRAAATRFSFLLSAPIVFAAGVKELPAIRQAPSEGVPTSALAVGFLVSFLVGLAAIQLLLRLVSVRSLAIFSVYRIAFAALAVALLGLR